MRILYVLAAGLYGVSAFPSLGNRVKRAPLPHPAWEALADLLPEEDLMTSDQLLERRAAKGKGSTPLKIVSEKEGNCGLVPCTTFSAADQLVSVTGAHAYASPATDEIRGPCPGLNAAANHAYLPRNGIADLGTTVTGLSELYSFGDEFAAALNAFSSIISGDIVTETWSIGGPMPFTKIPGLTPPQGISFSHNKYEGDISIGREDAYLANGDAHSLNATRFQRAYAVSFPDDRFTMDKFRKAFQANQQYSISHNPYFFSAPLATAIVSPGAYYFVINFMSNHTAAEPNGYLDRYNIGQFFAVRGPANNLRWLKGQERVPENWYRRTPTNPYGAANFGAEFPVTYGAYPKSLKIGGNMGKVNSFQGVSISELSGGQFKNIGELAKGNNLACFAFQAQLEVIPDELHGTTNKIQPALALFKKRFAPIFSKLGCKPLDKYDGSLFNKFVGAHYDPHGKATNY